MNYYYFSGNIYAKCNKNLDVKTIQSLVRGFTAGLCEVILQSTDDTVFAVGDTAAPDLPDGKEYAIRVDSGGIAITAKDSNALMRGVIVLLLKIDLSERGVSKIPLCEIESSYSISNRMIHLCVFPENDLYFIKKMIRLAGVCQYTHVVLEFWGMLKYDCLKELAWPNTFTKEQACELVDEIRNFGMEPIPMFNQLGHATASRVCYGKHVVLDQNPKLHYLFTPDGWAWNIESDEVLSLLSMVRKELYEVFGNGEYMHIGCDEAYFYDKSEKRRHLGDYLAQLTAQVEREGRRPMLWMDMLLESGKFQNCYATGRADEVDALVGSLSHNAVFVDWQYSVFEPPVESSKHLVKTYAHDVIGAPWYKENNQQVHIDTITQNKMFGIMLTTWHTLKNYAHSIYACAKNMGAGSFDWEACSGKREITAAVLRKISFEGNDYLSSGWAKEQIEI